MREIKFRGKHFDSGEWLYGDLVHKAHDGSSTIMMVGIREHGCYPNPVSFKTIGQFTGLHDKNGKNGKEIYEGDIINNTWIVCWCDKDACYEFRDSILEPSAKEPFTLYHSDIVTGNIHESEDTP